MASVTAAAGGGVEGLDAGGEALRMRGGLEGFDVGGLLDLELRPSDLKWTPSMPMPPPTPTNPLKDCMREEEGDNRGGALETSPGGGLGVVGDVAEDFPPVATRLTMRRGGTMTVGVGARIVVVGVDEDNTAVTGWAGEGAG